jgi:hypothetical protein
MCNALQRHYTLCGHVLTEPSTHYWEPCRNALLTGQRCGFAVFSEKLYDAEGKCPTCVAAWVKEVDEREEKARKEWRGRLRKRDGNKGGKGGKGAEDGGIETLR